MSKGRGANQQEGEAIQNRKHQLWSFSKVLLLTTDNNVSATFDRRKEETINQRFLDRRLPIQYKHPYITDLGGKKPVPYFNAFANAGHHFNVSLPEPELATIHQYT